jgi:hypothetical protein
MLMRFLDHAIEIALELGNRTGSGLICAFCQSSISADDISQPRTSRRFRRADQYHPQPFRAALTMFGTKHLSLERTLFAAREEGASLSLRQFVASDQRLREVAIIAEREFQSRTPEVGGSLKCSGT